MRNFDLTSSLFWLFVGAGFTSGGFYYGFGSWKNPGPGMLPAVFGIVLAVLSTCLLAVTLRNGGGEGAIRQFFEKKGSRKRVFLTLLSLVGYLLFLNQAGFILTTFLFVFFLLRFIGMKRWITSILTALLFSFICYALFSTLLGTPLPKGRIYGSCIELTPWV